jgi:DNA helicase-2/ATP-dependent DNA helicase PcrA
VIKLSDNQEKAIQSSATGLQIVACAGSGKTEVLARRVVRFLLDGVTPDSIVAFTFTEKAAGELKDRIEHHASEADASFKTLPPAAAGLFVGTIHSYCLMLLQAYGGIYEVFDSLPEEREWALLHRFARRLGVVDLMEKTWPGRRVSVRRAVEIFRRSLAVVCNERIPRAVLSDRTPAFASVVRNYEELIARMQLLTFDQMVNLACEELKPGGKLRESLTGRIRQVIVDEYQDLNRAQEEILQRFVEMGAHLTVVGDDDQAIYQWRGGDVSLFVDFPGRYRDSQRIELAENFRSRPPIIALAGEFATTIKERVTKSMRAGREENGPAIELIQASTPEEEAESLVRRIRSLLSSGHKPGDIAVLYRSVRTSGRPLINALRKESIPIALVGRLSLLDRPEMALLARVFVLWGGGSWRPDEELEVITPEKLALDISELTGASQVKTAGTVADLQRMGSDLAKNGVRDLVGTYMEMLRLIGLPAEGPDRKRQEQGLGNLSQLLADFEHAQRRAAPSEWFRASAPSATEEEIEDFVLISGTGDAEKKRPVVRPDLTPGQVFLTRLRVFLEEYASQAAEEPPLGPTLDQDAVNIMTVHQSKGLEFPVVFVPALVDRRFPSARMDQEVDWYVPKDLFDKKRYQGREDDERRLFYVATTRAREMAVFSWFTQYPRGPAKISRFVKNLAECPAKCHLCKAGRCQPEPGPESDGKQAILDTDFGQLLTFSECPYKYYLGHVCGFKPPIAPALGFGKILHHVLAELARRSRNGVPPNLAAMDTLLNKAFYLPFAGPIEQEKLFSAAQRRLKYYVRNFGRELVRTIEVERRFEWPMKLARVRGRIDLLLQAKDGGPQDVELVDYKTAANRPPSMVHQNQLRVYAEAVRALGMNPIRLIIHDLDAERGEPIPVEDSPHKRALFSADMQRWLEQIHAGDFPPNRSDDTCPHCDFVRLCDTSKWRKRG